MKRSCLLTSLLIVLCLRAAGQQSFSAIGARSMALGKASSCLNDQWSLFSNTAGLAQVKHSVAGFTYTSYPSFAPFNHMAVLFAFPTGAGTAALGMFRFGDDLYNEHVASAGFSNKFGIAALGVRVSYMQYHIPSYGTSGALTISAGGIADLTPHLSVSAHIVNINQPAISDEDAEHVPGWLVLGILLRPSEKARLMLEVEKKLDTHPTWKSALEYEVHTKLIARTGVNLHPQAAFGGMGFVTKKFRLDYAVAYDFLVGMCHQATVNYSFTKKT